jgi:hypothetical protein
MSALRWLALLALLGCTRDRVLAKPAPPSSASVAAREAAAPMCGTRSAEPVAWVPLPLTHAAYPVVRRFANAMGIRDVAKVADATGLPLHVRYPREYRDEGRQVAWGLDVEATDASTQRQALAFIVDRVAVPTGEDPEADRALSFALSRFIDMDPASTATTVRARVCSDYNHLGDGVFDELNLTLTREGSGAYVIHRVEVGWFEQR